MLNLSGQGDLPLYQALYLQLRQSITGGELRPGSRLPSRRKLKEQLHISINTVDAAYAQLEAEGFIESRPRRGYFVLETGALPGAVSPRIPKQETAQKPRKQAKACAVDFSPGGVARDRFPYGVWRRLMKGCFNEYDEAILLRTPPRGDPGLREQVASYLYRVRGVSADPEQIIIGAGTDQLAMMLAYLLPEDFLLAAENPLYHPVDRIFSRFGHRVLPVDVTPRGIPAEHLPNADRVLVYATPSHQYPLGYSMPIRERTALLRWSAEGEARYILEDDYDSEFRYDSRPIPSLQSIDTAGRVIYLGTFSRSVAPALRISYMVLPPELLTRYEAQYESFASPVSGFEQAVLREFLKSGQLEVHVNRLRSWYRARRACLVQALAPLLDTAEILGQPAGHHLTLRFRDGRDEAELIRQAAEAGVKVYPVSACFLGEVPEEYRATVLLGFGGLGDEEIKKGAELLCRAWRQEEDHD